MISRLHNISIVFEIMIKLGNKDNKPIVPLENYHDALPLHYSLVTINRW